MITAWTTLLLSLFDALVVIGALGMIYAVMR
jgi:hypothetical protein